MQEPFSNYFIERELAKMGMQIERKMNFTSSMIDIQYLKNRRLGSKYVKHDLGSTANYTIGETLALIQEGCVGIIHVKSFGCTPEIDAMPILQNISADYKVPILHFSFDTQTSETGVLTRLEAFYDMIVMQGRN